MEPNAHNRTIKAFCLGFAIFHFDHRQRNLTRWFHFCISLSRSTVASKITAEQGVGVLSATEEKKNRSTWCCCFSYPKECEHAGLVCNSNNYN